jgi:hypothetical protein
MPELLFGIVGLLVAVVYLATPFFAIAAWLRTRRLEERLREAERRLTKYRDAVATVASEPAEMSDAGMMPAPAWPQVEPPPLPPLPPRPPVVPQWPAEPVREGDATSPILGPLLERPVGPRPPLGPEWQRDPRAALRAGWRSLTATWEDRIGGSVLSKAGALLVVIGVSLFVGWSMVHLGPVGRVAISLALSGALLAGGLAFQRWPQYRSVALGLSAAGWGGLYVTTYAMHGLEAARVIDDPRVALGLLLAVAAGMIVHTLWLGVPMLVAVAYAAAFAAVALGPASTYAAVACLVLAATLLAVAARHEWAPFAVGGILCTYGTLALRFPPADPTGLPGLGIGHALVWACWVMFEAYDVVMAGRGRGRSDAGRAVMPLNLCGLLGVSLLHWPPNPQGFDLFLAAAAAAYAVSSVCRIAVRRRTSPSADAAATAGGHELSITIAAVLWGMALWMRFEGGWRLHVGLLMEAEILFLLGVACGQRFLRGLAAAVVAVLLLRFVACDVPPGGDLTVGGLLLTRWTPSALLAAALLVVNRAIVARPAQRPALAAEAAFTHLASGLVALVIGGEAWHRHLGLGPESVGLAWLMQAWILLQIGLRLRFVDAYWQACLVASLAVVPLAAVNAFPVADLGLRSGQVPGWVWLAPAVLLLQAIGWQLAWSRRFTRIDPAESDASQASLLAAAVLAVALIWHALPAPLVALGWGAFAILSFQLGLRVPHAGLRWHAYAAVALAVGRLFLANFTTTGMTAGVSHRLLTVVPIILMLYDFAARLRDAGRRRGVSLREAWGGRLCSWAGTVVLLVLLRFELGRTLAVVGWAAVGVALLALGRRRSATHLRWQSHAIALLTFARSWGTGFHVPESPDGLLQPAVLGGLVVASLFLCELLCPPDAAVRRPLQGPGRMLAWLDAHRRSYYGILGTILLAVLLVHEVPAALLTAALGIEGAALLVLGFVRPDRGLRVCGLAVLGIGVAKLFLHDLRHLDTPYRILSFLLLGMLLIAASWVYARFKSRLRDLL